LGLDFGSRKRRREIRDQLKAISVRQPWAWAIAWEGKTIENRTWRTNYRGPLAIHAASTFSRREYEVARAFMLRLGIEPPAAGALDTGRVVAVTTLVDVRPTNDSSLAPWETPGGYAFMLRDTKPIKPFVCRGMQGLWTIPTELVHLLDRTLSKFPS